MQLTLCCPTLFGLEGIVADELRFGGRLTDVHAENGRVLFTGDENTLAWANLNLRCAERVLIRIGTFKAKTFDQLFEGVKALPWEQFIPADGAFPVKGHSLDSALHSIPDCQKIIKKAVVSRLGAKYGQTWFDEIGGKNKDNILPLPQGKKLLVTGPNANSMRCLNGGWSYSWQGHLTDRFADKYNTIYEAICNKFGADHVRLEQGVTYKPEDAYMEENEPEIEKAVAAARNVDIIIACIGENSYCETPGNLSELAISANQSKLVKALAATGKPIILILNEGRPRIINELEPLADAVIDILLPGNYGGDALANILAGDVNPSAKMPYTYPRHEAALTTYDYRVSEEMDKMEGAYDYNAVVSVQWPFGYGLSYTTFEYSNFQTDKSSFTAGDNLHFSIDVTNTGKYAGKEVVMLFSSDLVASLTPENRRLRAFKKVELQPGETQTVTLSIKGSDLAFVNSDGQWVLEQGDFRMQCGNQVLTITYK